MSYCRFSSDNWKSDVYVYDAGYVKVIHVAGSRGLLRPIPELPAVLGHRLIRYSGAKWNNTKQEFEFSSKFKKFINSIGFLFIVKINKLNSFTIRLIPLVSIRLKHAGETFECSTTDDCIEKLEYLRRLGYNVPQSAINALLQESTDEYMEKGTNDNS